jgi:hypothetical protein
VGIRLSEDSSCLAKGAIMDEAVNARSLQRQQVLEEIIQFILLAIDRVSPNRYQS